MNKEKNNVSLKFVLGIGFSGYLGFYLFPFLWEFYAFMSQSSLWTDELRSLLYYVRSGSLFVVTRYEAPNNHVFFNLLNSVLPTGGNVYPLSARIISFICMTTATVFGYIYVFRKHGILASAIFLSIFIGSYHFIHLNLQARGYGLIASCCVALIFLLEKYLKEESKVTLVLIGVVTWLATWTIPVFVFFGGSLLIVLWVLKRERIAFFVGLLTMLLIGLSYAPIATRIIEISRTYGDKWGYSFLGIDALFAIFGRYYLNKPSDPVLWAFIISLVVIMFLFYFRNRNSEVGLIVSVILSSSVLFLVACYILKTPLIRTTAFVGIPLLYTLVLFTSKQLPASIYNSVLAFVILFFLIYFSDIPSRYGIRGFVPKENWLTTGRVLETLTEESSGDRILYSDTYAYLTPHLVSSWDFRDENDETMFLEGNLFVADLNFKKKIRFRGSDLSDCCIDVDIQQVRGGFQRVSFVVDRDKILFNDPHLGDFGDSVSESVVVDRKKRKVSRDIGLNGLNGEMTIFLNFSFLLDNCEVEVPKGFEYEKVGPLLKITGTFDESMSFTLIRHFHRPGTLKHVWIADRK